MRFRHAAIVMAASVGLGFASAAPSAAVGSQHELAPQPSEKERRRKMLADLGALPTKYRNRWKSARCRKRPNMNHVSRRTRRKHRRARAAA
jgi:hypothetical protein